MKNNIIASILVVTFGIVSLVTVELTLRQQKLLRHEKVMVEVLRSRGIW